MALLARSNVNPPAVHNGEVNVEGSNVHGAVKMAVSPVDKNEPNAPSASWTLVLDQAVTALAVEGLPVSSLTVPVKDTLPVIGMASTETVSAARIAIMVFIFIDSLSKQLVVHL